MNCRSCQTQMSAYLDQEMRGEEMLLMRRHLNSCPECAEELEGMRQVQSLLRDMSPVRPIADDAEIEMIQSRVMAKVLKKEPTLGRRAAYLTLSASAVAALALGLVAFRQADLPARGPEAANTQFGASSDLSNVLGSDPFSSHVPVLASSKSEGP